MSSDHLRKRSDSNHDNCENGIELTDLAWGQQEGEGENGEDSGTDVEVYSRQPEEDQKKLIIVDEIDDDGVVREYEVALKYLGFGLFHIMLMLINGIALSSDAVEVLSISFILPILKQDEWHIADWQNALLSSVIFVGMLFGSYLWGSLADISGRRFTLLISFTINGVMGFCSAFAPNYWVFLLFRFVSGIGVGGSLPVIFSYGSEFIRNKYRGPYLGIQSIFWMVGSLLCGAFAWIIIPHSCISIPLGSINIHSWRIFIAVSAVPALLGALLYLLLPESPRYLLEVGKDAQAMRGLKLAYRLNHLSGEKTFPVIPTPVLVALYPVLLTPTFISCGTNVRGVLLADRRPGPWKVGGSGVKCCEDLAYKCREILRRTAELFHRKLLRRTILLLVVLFCLSFGSYGVVLWYPAYVRNINELKDKMDFEAFCNRSISTLLDSLQQYNGCHNTRFEGMSFESFGLSNWRISGTFTNVTFHEVNFTNVVFKDCEFRNCKIQQVWFDSTYLVNSTWEEVALESVTFSSSDICGLAARNTSVEGFLTMSNVDVNGRRIYNETQVNDTLFLQLVESDSNATCLNNVGYGDVKCGEMDDNRVYRDNFFVAASALPGNLVSATAVYFLRRNYWLAFSLLSSTVSVFLLYIVHSEVFVVVMLCIFNALSTPAWNDSSLIISELYPTHLRSTALGMHLLMARIGAIIGTNLFGEFVYISPSIPILLVASVLLVGGIAALPIPKTTRKTLLG